MSKTKTKQQYRPVADFDEATQASKREYWRTKKREQRAKLSMGKRKSRSKNPAICKPVCTSLPDKQVQHIRHTLLNSNGSYQTDASRKPFKQELNNLSHKASNLHASQVEFGEALVSSDLPVCIKIDPHSLENPEAQTRSAAPNGNFITASKACVPNAVSQFASRCNTQVLPKLKCSVPPRSLATEYRQTSTNRKTHTYFAQCSTAPKPQNTTDITMTEEEMVAKRRENWRIKKREQRAKRAQMLNMHRERKQFSVERQEKPGNLSCTAPTQPSLSVNAMVLRRGRQPSSAVSVNLKKSAQCGVNMGKNNVLPSRETENIQRPLNSQVLLSRNLPLASTNRRPINNNSVIANSLNYQLDSESDPIAISSRDFVQSTRVNHGMPPKFVQIQRRQHTYQRNNRAETPEERLAKQREYWRIKKRLQRAKHSLVAKSRLKEQNAFSWRAKYYQSIMEQIRRTPTSFETVSEPNTNTFLNTGSTITGFIQEDGTVSMSDLKTSATRLPPHSYDSSAVPSNSHSQRIANVRARPVLHSLPNDTNSTTASRNVTAFDPIITSKQANSTTSLSNAHQMEKPSPKDLTDSKRNVNRMEITSTVVSVQLNSAGQDPVYPSIASVFSLSEESLSAKDKDIKPAPFSLPDVKSYREPCSVSDNQATTLLVVESMQRLLEESLSSVVDNSTSTSEDKVLLCKIKDDSYSQEEEKNDFKPDLTKPHEVADCNFPLEPRFPVEVKPSPSPCPSVAEKNHVSYSCTSQAELPCTATTAAQYFQDDQNSGNKRNDQQVLVGMIPLCKGHQKQNGSRATIRQKCAPRQANRNLQLNETSDLQKKREYWRVMKRQQRARKAKEMEKSKDAVQNLQQMQRKRGSVQFSHPLAAQSVSHTDISNHVIQATVPTRLARPVLSPTSSVNQQPSNIQSRQILCGGQHTLKTSQVKKFQSRCQRRATTLSTKPSAQMNHVKLPGPSKQTRGTFSTVSKSNRHFTTANKELDPDDVIYRKRMLWRIKKQEQRARKAALERQLRQQRTLGAQLEHNWTNDKAEAVQIATLEKVNYISESCHTTSLKDEPDVCVLPDDDCSDEHLNEDKWRSLYLMDHDPINQLLVCMVCGEQQYTLSAEAVRAHIQEIHPSTLCLEDVERECIQQAWDQQVAMRERFYTNQLWQNNDAPKEPDLSHTAEIEVILEADDKSR